MATGREQSRDLGIIYKTQRPGDARGRASRCWRESARRKKQVVGLESGKIWRPLFAVRFETEAVRWLNEAQQHMYSFLLSVVSELPRLPFGHSPRTIGSANARSIRVSYMAANVCLLSVRFAAQ